MSETERRNVVVSHNQTGGITANTVIGPGTTIRPIKQDFGWALAQMREGARVRRSGWNGKSQWVCWMSPMTIPAEQVNTRTRKYVSEGDIHCGGYYVIYREPEQIQPDPKSSSIKDGWRTWQPGWTPSTSDIQADDWEIAIGDSVHTTHGSSDG